LKLIACVGYVGCAKYTRIGGKEGNVGVIKICEWVFSLDLITYCYTGVLLVPWLQICGDLTVG
jgi:hypothetical protein